MELSIFMKFDYNMYSIPMSHQSVFNLESDQELYCSNHYTAVQEFEIYFSEKIKSHILAKLVL